MRLLPTIPVATLTLLATLAVAPAQAGEQTLEFRLVTKQTDIRSLDVADVEGQTVFANKVFGVAMFKDGRLAAKNFVFAGDFNKGSGPFYGYSTYQFEDGSTLTMRFAGVAKAGQPLHGDYTILSGTGLYAGAKGTGAFDAVPHKMAGSGNYVGRLNVITP